jgi:proteasome assembly chaperone (PAC2) family protein
MILTMRKVKDEIIYYETPNLIQPYLIAGFEGWPNAAEVSSFCIHHLVETLKAKKFASIPTENFYQTSSNRPTAIIRDGKLIELNVPGNHFYYSRDPMGKDLILFSGIEPHLHWNIFTDLFLDLVEEFDVAKIFTMGGTYDYIPHTHPTLVSALFNEDSLKEEIIKVGLNLTEYAGPISIHTFLLQAVGKRGLKAVSLWGHAPHYLQARNIKVAYGVLKKLKALMKAEIDLSGLENASDYFDHQVNDLVSQDSKLQEIINKLEEAYLSSGRPIPFGKRDEPKEDKVVTIQAFLKRKEDEEKKES